VLDVRQGLLAGQQPGEAHAGTQRGAAVRVLDVRQGLLGVWQPGEAHAGAQRGAAIQVLDVRQGLLGVWQPGEAHAGAQWAAGFLGSIVMAFMHAMAWKVAAQRPAAPLRTHLFT